jgi:hypothetical protein
MYLEAMATTRTRADAFRRVLTWIFLAEVPCGMAVAWGLLPGIGTGWFGPLLLLTATVLVMACLVPSLPLQNLLAAAAVIGFVSLALQWAFSLLGLVPWPSAHARTFAFAGAGVWVLAVLLCRGLARTLLTLWRHPLERQGHFLIILASVLATAFFFCADPCVVYLKNYWSRRSSDMGDSARLLGPWFLTATLAQIASTPWLLRKKPGQNPPPIALLLIWTGTLLYLGTTDLAASMRPRALICFAAGCLGPLLFLMRLYQRRSSATASAAKP